MILDPLTNIVDKSLSISSPLVKHQIIAPKNNC